MSLQRSFIKKCPIMQQSILLHTRPGHALQIWFLLDFLLSDEIGFESLGHLSCTIFKVFSRLRFASLKPLKLCSINAQNFLNQPHLWTTENRADNQIGKAGFRPLCNKIPFLHVQFCSVSVRETELWLTCSVRFGQNGKTPLRSVTTV